MAGDANFGFVSLLAHLAAASGATTPDTSTKGRVITLQGGASIVADADFVGGFALSAGGNGACADTPGTADLAFAGGDFCVEGSLKTTDTDGGVIDAFVAATPTSWQIYLEAGRLTWYAGNTKLLSSAATVNNGALQSFAFARTSGTLRLFINGALVASAPDATVYTFTATKLSIGRQLSGSPSAASDLVGKIGEVRITSGISRYTGNYSVPAAPFPDYAGVISGTVKNEAGALTSRILRAYRRDTGALVGSGISDPATGAYEIRCMALNECSVICLDDPAGTVQNDLILRAVPA